MEVCESFNVFPLPLLADEPAAPKELSRGVDVLLCETMSCAREARAAVEAACESDLPVWLSWTLQGDRPDKLPSGETIPEAFEAVAEFDLEAIMVNCCGANFVTPRGLQRGPPKVPDFCCWSKK